MVCPLSRCLCLIQTNGTGNWATSVLMIKGKLAFIKLAFSVSLFQASVVVFMGYNWFCLRIQSRVRSWMWMNSFHFKYGNRFRRSRASATNWLLLFCTIPDSAVSWDVQDSERYLNWWPGDLDETWSRCSHGWWPWIRSIPSLQVERKQHGCDTCH